MTDQPRVLIVEARFYQDIADELVKGAAQVLEPAGFGYDRIEVPGVFELPAAIKYAVKAMEFHSAPVNYVGFIALGCVIRGETDHYDHICREASRSLKFENPHPAPRLQTRRANRCPQQRSGPQAGARADP